MLVDEEGNRLSCLKERDKWYQSRSDPSEWLEDIIEDFHWRMTQTALIRVYDVVCPITELILHQVFDSFGAIEEINVLPVKDNIFQALLRFRSIVSVSSSIHSLNGRNIYDQGCKLEVKHLSKEFFDELGAQNPLGEGIEDDVYKSLKEMAMAEDKVIEWVQESELRRKNSNKDVVADSSVGVFEEMPTVAIVQAQKIFCKAVSSGLLKILSKMGISLLSSYCGAEIFEVCGLGKDIIGIAFCGSVSNIGGLTLDELGRKTLSFWVKAFSEDSAKRLENFGFIQFRPGGVSYQLIDTLIIERKPMVKMKKGKYDGQNVGADTFQEWEEMNADVRVPSVELTLGQDNGKKDEEVMDVENSREELVGVKIESASAKMMLTTCLSENGCRGIGCTAISYSPKRVEGPFVRQPVTKVSCGWKHTSAISGVSFVITRFMFRTDPWGQGSSQAGGMS